MQTDMESNQNTRICSERALFIVELQDEINKIRKSTDIWWRSLEHTVLEIDIKSNWQILK
jgi:hypothetical protein